MDHSNYQNVVALARNHKDISKVKMILNYSFPESDMNVPDPWYGEEPGYEDVFQLLDQAANNFFNMHFDG
jgi:protein-tyrosine phosphatase